jgi:hypothetical protein
MRLWIDRSEVELFDDITRNIATGLAYAKTIVCFFSEGYAKSRACQWELTTAYIAAERAGLAQERVLIVNPAAQSSHIPQALRASLCATLPPQASNEQLNTVASRVYELVSRLDSALGQLHTIVPPPWYPHAAIPWPRFVGRLAELWRIHSLLHRNESVATHGRPASSSLAFVHGMGGMGKSLLAEEYAARFGVAFPGGIFWLGAKGEEQDTIRSIQFQQIAEQRGIPTSGLSHREVVAALRQDIERSKLPCLWIVDDVPHDLTMEDVQAWLGPHPLCHTIITTRSQRYSTEDCVDLGALEPSDAIELLRMRSGKHIDEEVATALLEDLGRHALACEVVGARLVTASVEEVRAQLEDKSVDALEFAARFSNELPHKQNANVSALLFGSIALLEDDGREFLRLASVLAGQPIPRVFVCKVFERLGRGAAHGDLGIDQTQKLSLTRRVDAYSWTVHTLVSRAVTFREVARERIATVRQCAMDALLNVLPAVCDISNHPAVRNEVAHARHMASNAESIVEAAILEWVARHDDERGLYVNALMLMEKVIARRVAELGEEHPETLLAMATMGTLLDSLGQFAVAREVQERVVKLRTRVLGEEHLDTLTAMNNLSVTLSHLGELAATRVLQEKIVELEIRLHGMNEKSVLTSIGNLAETLRELGEHGQARAMQEQLLHVLQLSVGDHDLRTLELMNSLAGTLREMGELKASRAMNRRVLAIRRQALGEEHPDTLISMSNLALVLWPLGNTAEAGELLDAVLSARRRVLGPQHPDTVTSMSNLAMMNGETGDFTKAKELQEQVLAIRRSTLGDQHPKTLRAMSNLSLTLCHMGDWSPARELQEVVLAAFHRTLGKSHPHTLYAMGNLAMAVMGQGDFRLARSLVRDALDVAQRTLPEAMEPRVFLERLAQRLGM